MKLNNMTKILICLGLLIILIIVGISATRTSLPKTLGASTTPAGFDESKFILNDSHKITSGSAKITVIHFLDYESEASQIVYPAFKQMLKEYPDQVNYVIRQFPTHRNSIPAAKAAEAAGEQGKYWEMHDALFDNQAEWSESEDPQTDNFVRYAKSIGLDEDKFKKSLLSNDYQDKLTSERNSAIDLGANNLPTVYVNGAKYTGVFRYEDLKKILDAELAK